MSNKPIVFIGRLMLTAFLLIAHQAHAETAAEFYEMALRRIEAGETRAAIIELRNSLQQDLNYVPSWTLLAKSYLQTGDAPFAISSAEKALALGADPKLIYLTLARAHLMRGDFDALRALGPPSGVSNDDAAELFVIQGNALLEAHELTAANEKFTLALKLAADHQGALRGLALVNARKGRLETAQSYAQRAVDLDAGVAENWYVHGEVNRASNKYSEAMGDFNKASELNPGHAPALLGQAALLADAGKLEDALEILMRRREFAADELQGLVLMAQVLFGLGDQRGANLTLDNARAIIKSMPAGTEKENLPALMTTALLAFRDDAPHLARDSLNTFLRLMPGHRGARRLLAIAHLRLGAAADASSILQHLVAENPSDKHLTVMLAAAYALQGDAVAAEKAYAEAKALGNSAGWIYKVIGLAQAKNGRIESAIAAFDQAMQFEKERDDARLLSAYMRMQIGAIDEALDTVLDLISDEAGNAIYHNLAGALYLIKANREKASEQFHLALAGDPKFTVAHLNLAEIDRQSGNLEKAKARYLQILDEYPRQIGALRGLAELALQNSDHDEAILRLERIRKIAFDNIEDRVTLLRAYVKAGHTESAINEARELLRLAPDRVQVATAAAVAESSGGSVASARSILLEFVQRPTVTIGDLEMVANTQTQLRFGSDAESTRQTILSRSPNNLNTLFDVTRGAIRAGKYSKAAEYVARLNQYHPDSVKTLVATADLAVAQGRFTAALEPLQKAYGISPTIGVAKRLAQALINTGAPEKGIEILESRVDKFADDTAELTALAGAYLRTGHPAKAVVHYQKIVDQKPRDWRAHNNLAWAFRALHDDRALNHARRAYELAPKQTATLDTLGWLLSESGDHAAGLQLLREAHARSSTNEEIQLHLGVTLYELRRFPESRELLVPLVSSKAENIRSKASQLVEILDAKS